MSDSGPPKELTSIANYLLKTKKSGLRARHGKLQGQRVIFFKGKSGINSLLKPEYSEYKSFPLCKSRRDAQQIYQKLLDSKLIIKCTKETKDDNVKLFLCQDQIYDEENYYVWLYQGSQLLTYLAGAGVIVIILAGVMFPLWPSFMREGAWYLSMSGMSFLGFLFVLTIIRFVFWIFSKVFFKPGIWLFPNLYEDCGFFESFLPVWAWDIPPPSRRSKKKKQSEKDGILLSSFCIGDPLLDENDKSEQAPKVEEINED